MSDSKPEDSNLWAIHSEKEDRPAMCDWAVSEEAANQKMAELQQGDPDKEVSYWVTRLTTDEVASFKASGFIPADA